MGKWVTAYVCANRIRNILVPLFKVYEGGVCTVGQGDGWDYHSF